LDEFAKAIRQSLEQLRGRFVANGHLWHMKAKASERLADNY
jgi:hypothetical protein